MASNRCVRMIVLVLLAAVACAAFTGCGRGNESVEVTKSDDVQPTDARAHPNPFATWAKVIDDGKHAVVVTGVDIAETLTYPVLMLDIETGETSVLSKSAITVAGVGVQRDRGRAALSGESGAPRKSGLTPGGLWTCGGSDGGLREVVAPADCDILMDMRWSRGSNLLAAWIFASEDRERHLDWIIDQRMGQAESAPPEIHPSAVLVDIHTGSVKDLGLDGFPIGWSADGAVLYVNCGSVTAYDVGSGESEVVSRRQDIGRVVHLDALGKLVALTAVIAEGKPATSVEILNDEFETVDRFGVIWSLEEYELSPDGAALAYRDGGNYYVMNLRQGTRNAIRDVKGDLGPSWVNDDVLLVGSSTQTLMTVTKDGIRERQYDISRRRDE